MKCPECVDSGLRSIIRRLKASVSDGDLDKFYDEDGDLHRHDKSHLLELWKCSNGHQWETKQFSRCDCGWSARQNYDI